MAANRYETEPWNERTLITLEDKADAASIQVRCSKSYVGITRYVPVGSYVSDHICIPRSMARKIALAILKETDGPK